MYRFMTGVYIKDDRKEILHLVISLFFIRIKEGKKRKLKKKV